MHVKCDWSAYYRHQSGSGFSVYKGLPVQRGYGLFSNLFSRYAVPLLKYIGKTGFSLGKDIGEDIIKNNIPIGQAIKSNLRTTGKTVAFDALSKAAERVSQLGTGRRRRRRATAKRRRKAPKRRTKRRKTTRRGKKRTNWSRNNFTTPIDVLGY